jgi:hypothetical protein
MSVSINYSQHNDTAIMQTFCSAECHIIIYYGEHCYAECYYA